MTPRAARRRLTIAACGAALLLTAAACSAQEAAKPAPSPPESPFRDWAALVVAGDWRANETQTTEAFDHGRRDVAKALVDAGFTEANVRQFSVRPSWPGDDPQLVGPDPRIPIEAFVQTAERAEAGCLFYVTSHGAPEGVVFGPDLLLTPAMLAKLMAETCSGRPSVVVVSACYSGVFVPAVAAPERLVLTAARKDRTSFGCGADDERTYFDDCMVRSLPQVDGFAALPDRLKACVAARERATGMSPPSQPQVAMGAGFAAMAKALTFVRPPASP